MVETIAGALVPWGERALIKAGSTTIRHATAWRRMRQYRQLQRWTRSTLRVSTVYDWGYTCSLGEAVDMAANVVLGGESSNPMCWAFTSRYFVSQMLGKEIGPRRWEAILTFIINSEVDDFKEKDGFEHFLFDLWIEKMHPEVTRANKVASAYSLGSARGLGDITVEMARKKHYAAWEHARPDTHEALATLKEMYKMYHRRGSLQPCCNTDCNELRRRALKKRQCRGLRFVPTPHRSQRPEGNHECSINVRGWIHLREQWARFISEWDKIVEKASEGFRFPILPGLASMVFHDMATGYAAPSTMRRRGAKHTSEKGTTIVHPGELGALVSDECKLLEIRGSALFIHGIDRKWSNAADEFARYALARCDLVCTSRMTFVKAVEDWAKRKVKWDRCPGTLSEWKAEVDAVVVDEDEDKTVDDIKMILLRQAILSGRSIEVLIGRNTKGSVFGGLLTEESERSGAPANDMVMVVDRPLRLNVLVHKCKIANAETESDVIRDRWGTKDTFQEEVDFAPFKWNIKGVGRTGLPNTFALKSLGFEGRKYKLYEKRELTLEIA